MPVATARIGEWVLYTSLNRIRRGDETVALEPLASEALAYFAENPRAVISADDLVKNLWQRKFVGDEPVYRIIADLRRALNDDARNPRYIQTIRKRGYRLIADVEILESTGDGSPLTAAPAPDDKKSADRVRSGMVRFAGLAVTGVAIAIAAYFGFGDGDEPRTTVVRAPIVAVLPFENLSTESDTPLTRGLTDAVATRISGIRGIRVIAQNSTRQFGDSDVATREIAEALGANYLITGTALVGPADGEADRLRLNAHLVDVSSDTYQWSETYDLAIEDVFDVLAEIAEQVAQQLDLAIVESGQPGSGTGYRPNATAYEHYLRGRDAYGRGFQEADLNEAITELEVAIADDPDFAQAYASLGLANLQLFAQYWDRSDDRLGRARAAIDRALDLDPQLIDGQFGLGSYYLRREMLEPAAEHLGIVLRSRPSHTEALTAIAQVYQRTGELTRAVDALTDAVRFDPRNHLLLYILGQTQIVAGAFAAAEVSLERAITMRPELVEGYLFKAVLYMAWRGDEIRAAAELRRAKDEIGVDALMVFLLQPGVSSTFRFGGEELRNALRKFELDGTDADPAAYYLAMAEMFEIEGSDTEANRYYNLAVLELEQIVEAVPDEPFFRALLGSAYAGAGMVDKAIDTGETMLRMAPVEDNPWDNADYLWYMAEINLLAGRYDEAIDHAEVALGYATTNTPVWMRVEPFWDPVRDMPRFQALVGTD